MSKYIYKHIFKNVTSYGTLADMSVDCQRLVYTAYIAAFVVWRDSAEVNSVEVDSGEEHSEPLDSGEVHCEPLNSGEVHSAWLEYVLF